MSFLSVSGLSESEDNALQQLLEKRDGGRASDRENRASSASAASNPFQEAMMRASGLYEHDALADADNEFALPQPDSSERGASKVTTKSTPRTGAGARASTSGTPLRTDSPAAPTVRVGGKTELPVPRRAAPQAGRLAPVNDEKNVTIETNPVSSSFQADNPTDVDDLAPLPELVHQKLRRPLVETLGIKTLTRIQKLSWKAILDRDKDVLVRSETGSGKTLAYALPILHETLCACDINPVNRGVGTLVIVLCPTRELVLQITDTLTKLLRGAQFLTVGGIHGGENRHKEKARLRKGIAVLVATPGRLLDHLKATTSFVVTNVRTIVMDEADRLLDMGFEKAVREIMELMEQKCRGAGELKRVLVSATITDGVERLSHFALRANVARIGETQDTFSIPSTLRQHVVSVPTKHRLAVLASFLRSQLDAGAKRIVVFVSTADSTEFLYYLLSRLQSPFNRKESASVGGRNEKLSKPSASKSAKKMTEAANQHVFDASEDVVTFQDSGDDSATDSDNEDSNQARGRRNSLASKTALLDAHVFKLHGNMSQVDRASVFHAFKHGDADAPNQRAVLFCTDVAARGLDMPLVDWIVHYDPPTDPANYIHRVGRTARIGRSGDSILFLAPHEMGYAKYLAQFAQAQASADGTLQDTGSASTMLEKKYSTFLFYLTKLDPSSNHMWVQSTATLERAICNLVMGDEAAVARNTRGRYGDGAETAPSSNDTEDHRKDNLTRLALFAYQSSVRAYAGLPKEVKMRFFNSAELHLGHVAQSFGIDKNPNEVQRKLQGYVREDRMLARDNRKGSEVTKPSDRESGEGRDKRKRQRIELAHDERYHSTIAQKQRKITRDYAEMRRERSTAIKPLQFSEFDA